MRTVSTITCECSNFAVDVQSSGAPGACGHAGLRLPSRATGWGIGRMRALLWLIDTLIDLYIWLLIAQAILSWLLAFGGGNRDNRAGAGIGAFPYRVTRPAFGPLHPC